MHSRAFRRLLPICFALSAAACGGSSVSDTGTGPGPTPPTDTTKPPTVQRASLTVRVSIDPEDAALAQLAGIGVSGLTVRLASSRAGEAERTAVTAADGTARFDNLLEGSYEAGVDRSLTAVELARLAPVDRDAAVFAGGAQAALSPPAATSLVVPLVATRRGSLIISELYSYSPGPPVFYGFGHYLEVYNNADTTVFLDGVLIFRTLPQMHSEGPQRCSYSASFRTDTSLMWANLIHAFPGSGREYPLAPGTARVVAMDAIDHKAASPETENVDLSRAEFEEIGSEVDTDNPFAANLVSVLGGTGALGRGYPIGTRRSFGLALASAQSRMIARRFYSIADNDDTYSDVRGIPTDAVLDVVSLTYTPAVRASLEAIVGTITDCAPWLPPMFERSAAPISNAVDPRAMARKSLGVTGSGRELLQRTRTSARDFEYGRPLRRSLSK